MTGGVQALLGTIEAWQRDGRRVALATLVHVRGSSPLPVGSRLAVEEGGSFAGSVSAGCIEGAVIEAALATIADGRPRLLEFGIGIEQAFEFGLACGGNVEIFVERARQGHLLKAAFSTGTNSGTALLVTDLREGRQCLLQGSTVAGDLPLDAAALVQLRALGSSAKVELPSGPVFAEFFASPLRCLIVGAVHIAHALSPMAAMTGYAVTIIDPRAAFATAERFPVQDQDTALLAEWPDAAFQRLRPDARTAIVALSHDPKIDDPALIAALHSDAFYIGALGSRKNQAARRERLAETGFGDAALARIHGPVGLDIGALTPPEIAVAILAQMTAALRGKLAAGALRGKLSA